MPQTEAQPGVSRTAAASSGSGLRDCYLADEAGREVCVAHHDEAIFVSIPDAGRRMGLLAELTDAPWPFSDVSGYDSPADEGDGYASQEED